MNLRPSGYEPDELPGCSTPRYTMQGGMYLTLAIVDRVAEPNVTSEGCCRNAIRLTAAGALGRTFCAVGLYQLFCPCEPS